MKRGDTVVTTDVCNAFLGAAPASGTVSVTLWCRLCKRMWDVSVNDGEIVMSEVDGAFIPEMNPDVVRVVE